MTRPNVSLRDLDREPIPWNRAWLSIVFGALYLFSVVLAYEFGRAEMAELVIDAFEREEHWQGNAYELLDHGTKAMSLVLQEDAYLRHRIREEVPGWDESVAAARAMELDR